ncbi:MAG TPA: hypothetical protein ENN38_02935, partial [Actinobacteria bacterium]|nr:hypothetical protein [Actinomycetota bacterium]
MKEKSAKNGGKTYRILYHSIALFFLLGFTVFLFKPFLEAGFPSGFDSIGHCFKVKYIADTLIKYGRFVDWWEPWYCGHHLLLFYPPLSYILPVILQIFLNDPALAVKISIALGVFFAALSMYFLILVLIEKGKNDLFRTMAAVGGAAAYAFSPALIHFYAETGLFSSFYAMVFVPLCFIPLIKWLRTGRRSFLVGYAFLLAIIFFFHGMAATMVGFGSILFVAVYLASARMTKSSGEPIFKGIFLLFLALVLFVGLTAIWWVPYFAQIQEIGRGVMFDPSAPTHSIPLRYLFKRGDASYIGISFYIGFCAIFLSIFAPLFRKHRAEALGFWATLLFGMIISLGTNTPIYQHLPLISTV